jgi:hypothetical protein
MPVYSLIIIIIIIIIFIIIIIITISFMQGIYTHIPETNSVPKQHNVTAILSLLFMVPISLVPVLTLMYFYISIFPSMSAVPNMAVFCSPLLLLLLLLLLFSSWLFIRSSFAGPPTPLTKRRGQCATKKKICPEMFFASYLSVDCLFPTTNRPLAWPSPHMSQTIKATHLLLFTDDVVRFTSSLNHANPGCSLHLLH